MKRIRKLFVALGLTLFFCVSSYAATYYVDGAVGSDSNAGTSPGAGNAWATIPKALTVMNAGTGDTTWVKDTVVYSTNTGLSFSPTQSYSVSNLVGYSSTIGDSGRFTLKATAAITLLTLGGTGARLSNFIFDGNSQTGSVGVSIAPSTYGEAIINGLVKNFSGIGVNLSSSYSGSAVGVEVTGCGGTSAIYVTGGYGQSVYGCNVHDNTTVGIYGAVYSIVVEGNKVWNNTTGIYMSGIGAEVWNNTVDNNSSDGINIVAYYVPGHIYNNILTRNGGYGLNASALTISEFDPGNDYNWYGSGGMANTSGARSANMLAGYHDLSGDPQYNNAGAGDFTPKNSSVQAAYPTGWIGAVQPASSSAATTSFTFAQ
jgi:hypothetical protein